MHQPKNIVICPLNWGIGHATRCVPIINRYMLQGGNVVVAADGPAKAFLQNEFPNIQIIQLKGYTMRYAGGKFLPLVIALQIPLFGLSILIEHYRLARLIKKIPADIIISDNRYGLWHSKVKSIVITHQLYIQVPNALKWLKKPLHWVTKLLLKPFNEIWVPDYSNPELSLAGNLVNGKNQNSKITFIGPQSRFTNMVIPANSKFNIPDILVMLSGPGKQKKKLAGLIKNIFIGGNEQILIIGGEPDANYSVNEKNVRQVSHLATPELAYLLKNTPVIIARAGYSTIMDLHVLNRKAILIPTPGQWEQEYFALNPALNKQFVFIKQNLLSKDYLEIAMGELFSKN